MSKWLTMRLINFLIFLGVVGLVEVGMLLWAPNIIEYSLLMAGMWFVMFVRMDILISRAQDRELFADQQSAWENRDNK